MSISEYYIFMSLAELIFFSTD